MREIKFRAWDYEMKNMYKLVKFISHKDGINALDRWFSWEYVMQFTGLKDKNGKEIYEGDLLQEYPNYPIWKVFYEIDGFCIRSGDTQHRLASVFGFPDRLNIIGNIYENPDLCPSGDLIAVKKQTATEDND